MTIMRNNWNDLTELVDENEIDKIVEMCKGMEEKRI